MYANYQFDSTERILTVITGCLESLVHYKLLLVNKHGEKITSDRQQLLDDCQRMLRKLKGIDPQRARRYDELGQLFVDVSLSFSTT